MELQQLQINNSNGRADVQSAANFLGAKTQEIELAEIRDKHIIPVYIKDNEPVISHYDFIQSTYLAAKDVFEGEVILQPSVRVSHPIKGRIPIARNKPAIELLDHEKTLYYERLAFLIEIPSITQNIGGQAISLVVGGVKAYNQDNLNVSRNTGEKFKLFIGFKVQVCTNLCVWSDGFTSDIKVSHLEDLSNNTYRLFRNYKVQEQLELMQELTEYSLRENQFAQLLGRVRMYPYVPKDLKQSIPELLMTESQVSKVCAAYFKDKEFGGTDNSITLWNLYNLFTDANKTSYIDTFLERSANVSLFIQSIKESLKLQENHWFLT